jgi:prepilin-type N-terminal cleavage/methylation domain-containing protein
VISSDNRQSSSVRISHSDFRLPTSAFPLARSALTLLEMLLVLAILGAALAILYPATERLYQTHRFQQAVEEVRGKLAATRVRAIDDGAAYQFRYEPDGRRLLVMAHRQKRSTTRQEEGNRESPSAAPLLPWRFSGELPKGMRFGPTPAAGERVPRDRLASFPEGDDLSAALWSQPVLFFPDGSASDAEILLKDADGHAVRLAVRGLTGAASVKKSKK